VLQTRERISTFSSSAVFTFGLIVEFIKKFGVCQIHPFKISCLLDIFLYTCDGEYFHIMLRIEIYNMIKKKFKFKKINK
jgi:hypothetical protein